MYYHTKGRFNTYAIPKGSDNYLFFHCKMGKTEGILCGLKKKKKNRGKKK